MQHIAIIMAMRGEAAPFLESLDLHREEQLFRAGVPFEVYQGNLKTIRLSLVLSGIDHDNQVDNVATVPAALMTYLAIEKFAPDLVLNAGTAGGLAGAGCAIGEVYLGSGRFCFHDRRIPLPGFDRYGMGLYPAGDISGIARDLKLKTGTISTGNSLDLLAEDLQIIRENEAIIKDMEAAAIAWVCRILSVPMLAVKAITDLIDEETPTETQFMANFTLACGNLHNRTVDILRYLQEKGHTSTGI